MTKAEKSIEIASKKARQLEAEYNAYGWAVISLLS